MQLDVQIAAGGPAKLQQLADQGNPNVPPGAIDVDVLAKFQAKADATINGYLRLLYSTPLANPTEEIRDCAAALTVFYLRESKQSPTELEVKAHELRLSWLELVRTGRIRIDDPSPPKSSAVKSAVVPLGGDVTRDTLKGAW
jgi:phage gp36-like protein